MNGTTMVLQDLQEEVLDLYYLFLRFMEERVQGHWRNLKDTDIARDVDLFEKEIDEMLSTKEFNALEREIRDLNRDELMKLSDAYLKNLGSLDINASYITSREKRKVSDFIGEVEDSRIRDMLKVVWKHGDEMARKGIVEYLDGESDIRFDLDPKEAFGKTTRANGRKVYHLSRDFNTIIDNATLMSSSLILSHELHRDGLKHKNPQNTRAIVQSDMMMSNSIRNSYQASIPSENLQLMKILEQIERLFGLEKLNRVIDKIFSSHDDYWKLNQKGNLEYNGEPDLHDSDENKIKDTKSRGIEGSLINLLGFNGSNDKHVAAVQKLMSDSGMKMNEDGYWNRKEKIPLVIVPSSLLQYALMDFNSYNMEKEIELSDIIKLFDEQEMSKRRVQSFLDSTYGSAIGMMNIIGEEKKTLADSFLDKIYSGDEKDKVKKNQIWLNKVHKDGLDIRSMVTGDVERTTEFEEDTGDITLASSSVEGATKFREIHTGIDYGKGGTAVNTPGGFWQVIDGRGHRLFLQLLGSDLKMRIMHLKPSIVSAIKIGTIFGSENGSSKIADYPTESYGSGDGAHIHIDFTRRLAHNGAFERQFVNPETLQAGVNFEYEYSYKDKDGNDLPTYPRDFYRY